MRIFISYAHEDIEHAEKMGSALSRHPDVELWFDKMKLLPGDYWNESILDAIEKSDIILLLLSTHSVNKSGFVQKEFREAIERISLLPPGKKLIIPVRLDECTPLHRELKRIQYLDMFPDWDVSMDKLFKSLSLSRYNKKYVALGANKKDGAILAGIDEYTDLPLNSIANVNTSDIPVLKPDMIATECIKRKGTPSDIFVKLWTIASTEYPESLYRKSDWNELDELIFLNGTRSKNQKIRLVEIVIRQWALAKEMPGYDEDYWKTLRMLIIGHSNYK